MAAVAYAEDAWPRQMTAETLVRYLDLGSKQTLYRRMRAWKGFPQKDPRTGRWDRQAIDRWLAPTPSEGQADSSSWRDESDEWADSL